MANKSPNNRLKRNSDFQKIKKIGQKSYINQWLMVSFLRAQSQESRVGWTIPTYVGSAVTRNKFKRWIREFINQKSDVVSRISCDINIIFRKHDKDTFKNMEHKEFDEILAKSFNLIRDKIKRASPQNT